MQWTYNQLLYDHSGCQFALQLEYGASALTSTLASRSSDNQNGISPTGKGKRRADDPPDLPPRAKKRRTRTCRTCKKDTCQGAFNSRPCQFSSAAGSSGSVHGGLSVPAVASSSSSGGLRQGTIDGAFSRSAAPESSDGANRASYYR